MKKIILGTLATLLTIGIGTVCNSKKTSAQELNSTVPNLIAVGASMLSYESNVRVKESSLGIFLYNLNESQTSTPTTITLNITEIELNYYNSGTTEQAMFNYPLALTVLGAYNATIDLGEWQPIQIPTKYNFWSNPPMGLTYSVLNYNDAERPTTITIQGDFHKGDYIALYFTSSYRAVVQTTYNPQFQRVEIVRNQLLDMLLRDYQTNIPNANEQTIYDSGYNVGYNKGYNVGYTENEIYYNEVVHELEQERDKAYDKGYDIGYQNGLQNGSTYEIDAKGAIMTIVDVPARVIDGLLNFEVFGINLLGAITGLLTLLVVAWVIKKIV